MHRQMLRLTFILGVLVTVLGGTGVFASFTDTAQGGVNSVGSGARPSAADLQIATATVSGSVVTCGAFSDNTSTAQFTLTNVQPTTPTAKTYICLRNVGSGALTLSMTAPSLRDLDTSCTGDEAAAGDTTCGNNGQGELSDVIAVGSSTVDCRDIATILGGTGDLLSRINAIPAEVAADVLAAGATSCVELSVRYVGSSETEIQVAQSDTVTWNFLFTGVAS